MITSGLDNYWCAVAFVVSQLFSCSVYRFFIVEFTTLSYILPLLETKCSNKTTVEPLLSNCIVWHGNRYAQYTIKEKIQHLQQKGETTGKLRHATTAPNSLLYGLVIIY